MTGYEFDVALSFAGEDRSYVEEVAHTLRDAGATVFYDQFETVQLWGANLYERLDQVYRSGSRYAVVFISEHYARKHWTMLEKRSIQAREVEALSDYLLPVRLDDTEIAWVSPIAGHLDARQFGAAEIAAFLLEKLGHRPNGGRIDAEPFLGVPLTPTDKLRVVSARPPGWEFLLLAGVVWQHTEALTGKRLDQEMGYAPAAGRHVDADAVVPLLRIAMDQLATATAKVERLFGGERLAWATGRPHEPGDPVRIEHLGQRFAASYEEILDWAAGLRGTAAGPDHRRLLESLARLADEPVQAMQRFVNDLVSAGGRIAAHAAAATVNDDEFELFIVSLGLTLRLDAGRLEEFNAELMRLAR